MSNPEVEMREHYARGLEAGRLDGPKGVLEFERTEEIVQRALPAAPALIADVGGGPGRYARWLAEQRYEVEHRDLTPLHVHQLRAADIASIRTQVGDARSLDLPDASVDVVLLLGPLYHLLEREQRVRALRESRRVVRPGGPVFIAAISRWAPRLDGILTERLYQGRPHAAALLAGIEASGQLPPFDQGSFSGYVHRPSELVDEIVDAGLDLDDLVGIEGLPLPTADLAGRLDDPTARSILFDAARAIERIPELLGLSSHLLATTRRPNA